MRLINKILRYNFTETQKKEMLKSWIVNWCWGKWWFRFDDFIQDNIKYFPNFIKSNNFINDVYELCIEHDYDFSNNKWFYKSNYYFARWIFKLTGWTTIMHRLMLSLIIFLLLCKYWKKYYSKG